MQELAVTLAVLQRALHNEIAGQRFYSDAARFCIDLWAKEVFSGLAQDEDGHARLLLAEYESLDTTGRWLDPEAAMVRGAQVDITRFTFPAQEPGEELFPPQWSAAQVLDRRADDLAALAFGIQMEQQAIALYGEQAEAVQDPAARQAYRFLLREEAAHFQQLKDRWEELAGVPFSSTR